MLGIMIQRKLTLIVAMMPIGFLKILSQPQNRIVPISDAGTGYFKIF